MDDAGQLHEKILFERRDLRPFSDVRPQNQLHVLIGLAKAKVAALFIHALVKLIRVRGRLCVVDLGRSRQNAVVSGRRRNRARVHQHHARQLTVCRLRAFAVREVACSMADGKAVVGRYVSGAKARAAEAGLEQRTRFQQLFLHAVPDELQIDRHRRRIDRERKIAVSDVMSVKNCGGLGNVVVHAARAAGDHALIDPELVIFQLVGEFELRLAAELLKRQKLRLAQNIRAVFLQLADGEGP